MSRLKRVAPMLENQLSLHTERLHLRKLSTEDVDMIQFLRSDEWVNHFIKRKKTRTIQQAMDFIKTIENKIVKKEICYWCIDLKSQSKMIGTICLWKFSKDPKVAEVGYDLHPVFQGKGYMVEALKEVLGFGFYQLKLVTIQAFTHKDNERSKSLLLKSNFSVNSNRKDDNNPHNLIYECKRILPER